jgi:hypothetical protein
MACRRRQIGRLPEKALRKDESPPATAGTLIAFNLCQYGTGKVSAWGGEVGHCWRTKGTSAWRLAAAFPNVYKIGLANARHWETLPQFRRAGTGSAVVAVKARAVHFSLKLARSFMSYVKEAIEISNGNLSD